MVGRLRHRGPDGVGVYIDGEAALGHARLSIIDLAGGSQPMTNEDGSLWIVFNGEIFNYVELREELLGRGHIFSTQSDTEVILHLFEDLGEDCVSRLNGQWAFGIWDKRRHRLFLARDRIGILPLFYTETGNSLLFASEIKALLAYPGVEAAVDLGAVREVFTLWHTVPPRTAFRGICELPPGHSATLQKGRRISVRRYWDFDYEPSHTPPNGDDTERTCADQLRELLMDATRLRLRSDVPVGAYLSGGLDSTLVTSLIREAGASHLTTFSVRFEDTDLDEGPYQEEAIRWLDVEHHHIRCSAANIGEIFPEVIWHAEKPVIRTAAAPLYLLSRLVRNTGYKVVLSGEGADEIFGGYDIFKEVKIRQFWASQPQSRLRPLLLRRLYPYQPLLQSQSPEYLKAFFHIQQDDTANPFFSHLPRWRLANRLAGLFSAEMRHQIAGNDPIDAIEADVSPCYRSWDSFSRAQYLEARYLLPGYILSSQGDRVAMANSVEGRFAFLDHRVVEFAARLPVWLKMRALQEKYILKKCAGTLVPPTILARYKQPYRAPDATSFFGPRAPDYVRELLSPDAIRSNGLFDPRAVEKLVEKARRGAISGVSDNMAIVGIISTQLLIDKFVRKVPKSTA
jgi:asparagine synthase (glutamine-hydrolysing)